MSGSKYSAPRKLPSERYKVSSKPGMPTPEIRILIVRLRVRRAPRERTSVGSENFLILTRIKSHTSPRSRRRYSVFKKATRSSLSCCESWRLNRVS